MTGSLVWVVGRGGFFGARLERVIRQDAPGIALWTPAAPRFSWHDPARVALELAQEARAFTGEARRRRGPWAVAWCAAAGGVGTTPEALTRETDGLKRLLAALRAGLVAGPDPPPGVLLLSSSAGGVYGESRDLPLTEQSPCRPISAYGRTKLDQEAAVQTWAREVPGASCLVARLSNLYGAGQRLDGPTGLIGRLSQCLLHRRPLHVYVPLDTLRDYVHVGDAARYVLRCLDRLWRADRPTSLVKIVAAEQSISIAGVVGIFTRVAKRAPRIVCMPHAVSGLQPSRLRFRSRVWTDCAPRLVDLAAGIREVFDSHLALLQQGRLPVPETPDR